MSQQAQEVFLEIMDAISTHAAISFRGIRCPHRREDFIQEALCLAWKWTLRMLAQEKDPREFPTAVATFAVKQVRSGRRFAGGKLGLKDVHSPIAQARFGFNLESLPQSTRTSREDIYGMVGGQKALDRHEEFLQEHDRSPVPDQVAFRIDFSSWRLSYDERKREMMDDMMLGDSTSDLAEKFKVSPGRISQMRREFQQAWKQYTDC